MKKSFVDKMLRFLPEFFAAVKERTDGHTQSAAATTAAKTATKTAAKKRKPDEVSSPISDSETWEEIKKFRKKSGATWSNTRKGVLSLQGKRHKKFGTPNVERVSKSMVRRIMRGANVDAARLEKLLDDNGK